MMLIAADTFRSIWLFVFSVVSCTRGTIASRSAFCQVNGFFTQMSFEMTDYATLLIAIHTALQVFKPKPSVLGQGGLYRWRHTIYASYLVLPAVDAAVAFIDGKDAYLSQGPLCTLPIRPFWYRLATSWIPRYIMMTVIISLYLAICIHAEHQFTDSRLFREKLASAMRRLSDTRKRSRPPPEMTAAAPAQSITPISATGAGDPGDAKPPAALEASSYAPQEQSQTSVTLESSNNTRHSSAATAATNQPLLPLVHNATNDDAPQDLDTQLPSMHQHDAPRKSSLPSPRSSHALATDRHSPPTTTHILMEVEEMKKKHRAVRRQLRLLFIYPIVYFIVWMGPFVSHATMYKSSLAAHPVFGLSMWATVCYGILGFIDALVFCLREKPWRHISGSDATLLGSFMFWRQDFRVTAREAWRMSIDSGSERRSSSANVSPTQRTSTTRRDGVARGLTLCMNSSVMDDLHDVNGLSRSEADIGLHSMAAWDFGTTNHSKQRP